ncbi:YceI family protein [Ekhidna sp.]|uniref:YceI family protein n=1 Tax=Ekhidna sp. TaxID=2608089 RepID=UPI0032F09786
MNKILLLLALLVVSCQNSHQESSVALSSFTSQKSSDQSGERVDIDLEKSIIKWRGTKLMGAGSHEGTVKFKSGYLTFSNKKLEGGQFVANMKSIYNTDIPLSDSIPRKNLTKHLNSDFNTKEYPESTFKIVGVKEMNNGKVEIVGDMTIMGISNPLEFISTMNGDFFSAEIQIDRSEWKIGEQGSWLEQKLVDSDFKIKVELYLN